MKNNNENNRIIGLLVNDMATDFSKGVIHGVAQSLSDQKDTYLVVLAGLYDNGGDLSDRQHCYKVVYNTIYKVAELCELDGLIFSLDRVGYRSGWKQGKDYLRKFNNIPKILVASDAQEGCLTVNFDNETGIREAVDCLVNVHGLERMCMLGGRDDNIDAQTRKQVFIKCLAGYGLHFGEEQYERSDMSINSEAAANRLLDRNPDVQAILCVNDATALGLYIAMEKRGLVPGRDIMVVGFDNTHMAEEMLPPLTSVGTDTINLGQRAAELVLNMMEDGEATSEVVRTRLYGRESLQYETYEYTLQELLSVDPDFINRMFDDCFYRYSSDTISREQVNLRRLFFEFVSEMLYSIKRSYMSPEKFDDICRMIDIFFENGAMFYTDAAKLQKSIERLQSSINKVVKPCGTLTSINRLFSRLKDKALSTVSEQRIREKNASALKRELLHDFVVSTMEFATARDDSLRSIIMNIHKLGLRNASLCLYDQPVICENENLLTLPEQINLCCIINDGELYLIPEGRQRRYIKELFTMHELFARSKAHALFPVFYGLNIYGLLICELTDEIYDNGEFIASQIGMAVYISELTRRSREEHEHLAQDSTPA